ncbi:hypothetical protein V8E36_004704 [Tilletia maclaganii]
MPAFEHHNRDDSPRHPPSDAFLGVPSSSIFGSPTSSRARQRTNSSNLSSLLGGGSLPSNAASNQTAHPAPALAQAASLSHNENLSVIALLSMLFSDEPLPPEPTVFPLTDQSPHSSIPSRRCVTARFLNHRIKDWLRGTGPSKVARRWRGMDTFATDLVATLVAKEIKRATQLPALKGPTISKINVRTLADYDPAQAAATAQSKCPTLQRVLDAAVGAKRDQRQSEEEDIAEPRATAIRVGRGKKRKYAEMTLALDLIEDSDEEAGIVPAEGDSRTGWDGRGPRSKETVASAILLMICFAHSSNCNLFQQVMGITLDATRIPKRPFELLSRTAACVSTDSVHNMSKALADDTTRNSRLLLQRPDLVFSLSIDNLNWNSEKRDKSATNRNNMMAAVAGTFYILDDKTALVHDTPIC